MSATLGNKSEAKGGLISHFYADDGRILTPPKELEPQLKGAFLAFSKLIGHGKAGIRQVEQR
jgi:hypothetical protein